MSKKKKEEVKFTHTREEPIIGHKVEVNMNQDYFINNAELGALYVFVDGKEYQVDTSKLDLNRVLEDIANSATDLTPYLHPVLKETKGKGKKNEK